MKNTIAEFTRKVEERQTKIDTLFQELQQKEAILAGTSSTLVQREKEIQKLERQVRQILFFGRRERRTGRRREGVGRRRRKRASVSIIERFLL